MKRKILGGLLGAVSLLAMSAVNAASVQVTPATQDVATGSTFNLTVSGTDLGAAVAGAFHLSWDPTVIQLQTTFAEVNTQITVNMPSFFLLGVSYTNDPTLNNIDISVGSLVGQVSDFAPTGTFDIANLAFTAVGTGISPATLQIGNLAPNGWVDAANVGLGETYTSATVNVVPIPAAVWLFGSSLLGLVGVARRRRGEPKAIAA